MSKCSSVRARVLEVIEQAEVPLTGQQVAERAGLSYKTAVDALNALHNYEKVSRTGRKFTARWSRRQPRPDTTAQHLDCLYRSPL